MSEQDWEIYNFFNKRCPLVSVVLFLIRLSPSSLECNTDYCLQVLKNSRAQIPRVNFPVRIVSGLNVQLLIAHSLSKTIY